MLFLPLDRKLDWRHPPIVTLALIVCNVLVFAFYQSGDDYRLTRAVEYYYGSSLPELELASYVAHREATEPLEWLEDWDGTWNQPPEAQDYYLLLQLQTDLTFLQRLADREIVPAAHPDAALWERQRATFSRHWDTVSAFAYGLKPAEIRPVALLTHMFLHGGLGHLIGNMVFLLAVGLLVEGALGRWLFLAAYLITGLGAAALFVATQLHSILPMVGASGAISGLMGLYAVLFGKRRVRFFVYLGVYFDYVKAPALILLGLWLGWELIQQGLFSDTSNVAYTAHIGGLLSGAALAFLLLRLPGAVDRSFLERNDREESFESRHAQASAHLKRLDFERALPLLEALQQERPDDLELLRQRHIAAKATPESASFHDAAKQILSLSSLDPNTHRWVLDTYRDYVQRAQPKPRLGSELIAQLARRFAHAGELREASRLTRLMLAHPQRFPAVPEAVAVLAGALDKAGYGADSRRYYQTLMERFPGSAEARLAHEALRRSPATRDT